jgi:hypothetical protein
VTCTSLALMESVSSTLVEPVCAIFSQDVSEYSLHSVAPAMSCHDIVSCTPPAGRSKPVTTGYGRIWQGFRVSFLSGGERVSVIVEYSEVGLSPQSPAPMMAPL